jgi:acyl dehydratase
METKTLITDSMRRAIGTESPALTTEIEAGAIRKFTEAIGDSNPLYRDKLFAEKSPYGSIIAPPTFLRSLEIKLVEVPGTASLENLLDAGSEWEYFGPVHAGDLITAITLLVDLKERSSKAIGQMLMISYETSYKDHSGTLVARQRSTFIRY